MAKSRFSPGDPHAVHERFERVRARAIKKIEEDVRQLKRSKPVPAMAPRIARRTKRTG